MATAVEVPKLGNTVEECLLASWQKRKGDQVAAGDVLAEIETDKTTFEITAPVAGTVLETFFDEGDLIPVFTNLCVIGTAGESVDQFRPAGAETASLPEAQVPAGAPQAPAAKPEAHTAVEAVGITNGHLSPRASKFAREHDFHPSGLVGSGPGGRVLEADVRQSYFTHPRQSAPARRQMEQGYVARVEGSGPAGLVRTADLGPAASRISSMRDRIAKRMRQSLAGTAQYTMHASANAAGLLALRRRVKATPGLPDVNINDLVVFCAIRALEEMPNLNVEFIDGQLVRHAEVNIGFACDTDRGLIVPVVHGSEKLSAAELAGKMKELAAQAVQGTINPDDLAGGTFTVSNLGSLGVESFTPLLNPPQVAILGVNAIQLKPMRKKDGNIEFIDAIGLSLTCDHQIVDGAPGARFLKVLREKIEQVESLCTI
jgi:pyruvate dehydrogenase E2 component (dihydrolipoamide acetyltransferase)